MALWHTPFLMVLKFLVMIEGMAVHQQVSTKGPPVVCCLAGPRLWRCSAACRASQALKEGKLDSSSKTNCRRTRTHSRNNARRSSSSQLRASWRSIGVSRAGWPGCYHHGAIYVNERLDALPCIISCRVLCMAIVCMTEGELAVVEKMQSVSNWAILVYAVAWQLYV